MAKFTYTDAASLDRGINTLKNRNVATNRLINALAIACAVHWQQAGPDGQRIGDTTKMDELLLHVSSKQATTLKAWFTAHAGVYHGEGKGKGKKDAIKRFRIDPENPAVADTVEAFEDDVIAPLDMEKPKVAKVRADVHKAAETFFKRMTNETNAYSLQDVWEAVTLVYNQQMQGDDNADTADIVADIKQAKAA